MALVKLLIFAHLLIGMIPGVATPETGSAAVLPADETSLPVLDCIDIEECHLVLQKGKGVLGGLSEKRLPVCSRRVPLAIAPVKTRSEETSALLKGDE